MWPHSNQASFPFGLPKSLLKQAIRVLLTQIIIRTTVTFLVLFLKECHVPGPSASPVAFHTECDLFLQSQYIHTHQSCSDRRKNNYYFFYSLDQEINHCYLVCELMH